MSLPALHRRSVILTVLVALLAFWVGSGVGAPTPLPASGALLLSLIWHPSPRVVPALERLIVALALVLLGRVALLALLHRGDMVPPVVDLLLLLLVAEALRPPGSFRSSRLLALSFALLLAASAYRPGLFFAVALPAYLLLGILSLMLEEALSQGGPPPPNGHAVPAKTFFWALPLAAAVMGFGILVFLVFPRVTQGWAGRGEAPLTPMAGFADQVALGSHGAEIAANPRVVLRVEFPHGAPPAPGDLYWRGRSYDHFDGVRWSRSHPPSPALTPPSFYDRWGGATIAYRVFGSRLPSQVIFTLHPLLEIQMEAQAYPIVDQSGDLTYWGQGNPVYQATSLQGRPPPDSLRGPLSGFRPSLRLFTQVPPLGPEITALADSVLGPSSDPYHAAVSLVSWFRERFTYTRALPPTPAEATLEHFLLRRRAGHCEYFATAMALLLRTRGIPTRLVTGFLGGQWSEIGGYLAVTQNEAHAWVEVWFPGFGWVPFDPTPPATPWVASDGSWLWPGRFFLDALQHRWNKWVLDYNLAAQVEILERIRRATSFKTRALPEGNAPRGMPHLPPAPWAVAGFLTALVLAAAWWRKRRVEAPHPASRPYLRLLRQARRAGLRSPALRSPLSLVAFLEGQGHPAAPKARLGVELYLRARFSGNPLDQAQRRLMNRAFREASSLLGKSRGGLAKEPDRLNCS